MCKTILFPGAILPHQSNLIEFVSYRFGATVPAEVVKIKLSKRPTLRGYVSAEKPIRQIPIGRELSRPKFECQNDSVQKLGGEI